MIIVSEGQAGRYMKEHQEHNIDPLYDQNSRILILGSFPSVKSRESGFFYGHPQNRFWRVVSALCGRPCPETTEQKKKLLLGSGIAVWDVIKNCDISGSSDSSIANAVPNDLSCILESAKIGAIFTNGGTSDRLYKKYCEPVTEIEAIRLPSTSPANAAYSLERLISEWKVIKEFL